MKRTLVAIMLGAVTLLAQASAWHVISASPKMRLEVDNATLKKVGNVVTVWTKATYTDLQPLDTGALYNVELSRDSIDCVNDTFITTTATFFNGKTQIGSVSFPKTDIPPDSIIQFVEKAVCP